MRRGLLIAVAIIITLLLLMVAGFSSKGVMIDMRAGRQGNCWVIMGFPLRHIWIEETPMSQLYRTYVGDPPPPAWFPASVQTLFSKRDYDPVAIRFASSSQQLAMKLRAEPFSAEARKTAILTFFSLANPRGNEAAQAYVQKVAEASYPQGKEIGPDQLPPSPTGEEKR